MVSSSRLPDAQEFHAPEILCHEVTRVYPGSSRPAVAGVSLRIPAGKITVLLGLSGSGKTTLLKMINRLVEPTSGQIFIGDSEIHTLPATQLRQKIGYVIQQVGLFPHMTVAQNIGVVPRLLGWDKNAVQRRTAALLEMVELPAAYAGRYPRHLSGGEQQRVGLARALAADPGILLMDEPFGALDAITRRNLQDQLLHIQSQVSKTILFVTHDTEETLRLADQIAVLQAGKLAQAGPPLEVLSRPADAFVARLVDSGNLLQRLSLLTAADVLQNRLHPLPRTSGKRAKSSACLHDDLRTVLSLMLQDGSQEVCVNGEDGRPLGVIRFGDLQAAAAGMLSA